MTLLERVRQIGSHARIVAAVLVLTTSIRFAIVAFGASDPPPPSASAVSAQVEPRQPTDRPAPPSTGPSGQPIRARISVLTGPDRADVYIDGSKRGQVPYLGDLPCRVGETVVVEVVPARGHRLRFERRCESGTIKVE